MEWPAQSPDLNPIEHLWAYIKSKVSFRMPKNIQELKQYTVRQITVHMSLFLNKSGI